MDKQCPTCPFLKVNIGKPTPTDFKCVEVNETDWYSEENIQGVYQVMRSNPIAFLSCHTTDPDYYGKDWLTAHACVGAAILMFMHMIIWNDSIDEDEYIERVSPKWAISKEVLRAKVQAFQTGKTSIAWGEMTMPKMTDFNLADLRWPIGFERVINQFINIIKRGHLPEARIKSKGL